MVAKLLFPAASSTRTVISFQFRRIFLSLISNIRIPSPSGGIIFSCNHVSPLPILTRVALEILDKAEKEGLILQTGNYQKLSFICTCCSCCCEGLKMVKKFDCPAKFYTSSYYARIDYSLCKKCKTCLNRCNMEAISFNNEKILINTNKCIGCGVCVINCPSKAIELTRKEKIKTPPSGAFSLFLKIMYKKSGTLPVLNTVFKAMWKTRLSYLTRRKSN